MHTLGKVLLFFVIVGAVTATVLTAQMLNVRGSWMEDYQTLKQSNEENARTIAQREAELQELRRELSRTLRSWERYWPSVPGQADPTGRLSVGIGKDQGLVSGQDRQPPGENPILYVFQKSDDGQTIFAGPFHAQEIRQNQSFLQPTWPVRRGEADAWQQPGEWRIWAALPPVAVTRFSELQEQLIEAGQTLTVKDRYVNLQQELLNKAKQQYQQRYAELLGPQNPPPVPQQLDGMENTHGLRPTIIAEEEARNNLLAEVDRLRREVKRTFARLQQLDEENKQMVQRLRSEVGQAEAETAFKEIEER